MEQLLTPEYSD